MNITHILTNQFHRLEPNEEMEGVDVIRSGFALLKYTMETMQEQFAINTRDETFRKTYLVFQEVFENVKLPLFAGAVVVGCLTASVYVLDQRSVTNLTINVESDNEENLREIEIEIHGGQILHVQRSVEFGRDGIELKKNIKMS